MPPTDPALAPAPMGLRERKKAQTRAAIQRHALRLFEQNGYSTTTMEQIAAAADVSPSTLYRYFPTKEDLVLSDDYDPLLEAAFRAQPPGTPILEALLTAIQSVWEGVPPEEKTEATTRFRFSYTIPEVRARALEHMFSTADMIAELFGERLNRSPDDLDVRVLAGTVIGTMLAAQQRWINDPDSDLFDTIERALQCLIDGLDNLTTP